MPNKKNSKLKKIIQATKLGMESGFRDLNKLSKSVINIGNLPYTYDARNAEDVRSRREMLESLGKDDPSLPGSRRSSTYELGDNKGTMVDQAIKMDQPTKRSDSDRAKDILIKRNRTGRPSPVKDISGNNLSVTKDKNWKPKKGSWTK